MQRPNRLALLLVAVLLLTACGVADTSQPESLLAPAASGAGASAAGDDVIGAIGLPFLLAQGQTAIFLGSDLRVRFVEVLHEERCPAEAACEWAGYATIALAVTEPDSEEQVVQLSVEGPGGPYGYENEQRVGPYLLRLEELNPYPQTPEEDLEGRYLATVLIDREAGGGGS